MNKEVFKEFLLPFCQTLPKGSPGAVTRKYRNWKGEVSERNIIPLQIYFEEHNEYHGDNVWIMLAWDLDKKDFRDFDIFSFINE